MRAPIPPGEEFCEPRGAAVKVGGQGYPCSPPQPVFFIRAAAERKNKAKLQKHTAWLSRGAEGKSTAQEIDSIKE